MGGLKRFLLISLVITLVISCAAPYGAVFATEEVMSDEDGISLQENTTDNSEIIDDEVAVLPQEELAPVVHNDNKVGNVAVKDELSVPIAPLVLEDRQLVISYVQTSGAYGKAVEIRNVSSTDYVTKHLSLQYVRANDTTGSTPDILATFYGTIPAGGRVVVGNAIIEQSGVQSADYYFTQTAAAVMSATGGWLLLIDDATELDNFCWAANANGLCGEDYYTPLPLRDDQAYARCFVNGQPVSCGSGLPFEAVERRTIVAGEGFVPFYNQCQGIEVSELAPQYVDQFIELYNITEAEISLERCLLQINTRVFQFSAEYSIEGHGFLVIDPNAIGVSLARTTAGTIRILSSEGAVQDSFSYPTPRENRSAIIHDDVVVWTLTMTPGHSNIYQQYADCEEGYWRNEETGRCNKEAEPVTLVDCGEGRERNPLTGRCRNIPAASVLSPCKEGQYRSEETNRCRSIATAVNALKPCADDQFRNPATNRCKKIASSDDVALADCGEGRERNPATNRCRNVLASTPPVAGFSVEPIQDAANVFIGWWVLGGVMVLALGYAGWEWREEVGRFVRKVAQFGRSK